MKIAVLMKDNFEELEALGIIDIARRHNLQCDMVGFDTETVTGAHKVLMKVDKDISDIDTSYDALILPGGGASWDLRDDDRVIELIQDFDSKNKVIGALCAAPIALEQAGVIKGKTVTSYPSVEADLKSANYKFDVVQVDGHIITGNGPGATFAFAFAVLKALGIDTSEVEEGMQYRYFLEHK
jgi:4-methyl-5(b-hydroxyethyl)-thiazole monophosphate biosynthesis